MGRARRTTQDAADSGATDGQRTDKYYNLKVNYIWWAMAVHLLRWRTPTWTRTSPTFDVDFGPDDASAPNGPGRTGASSRRRLSRVLPAARVALRGRF